MSEWSKQMQGMFESWSDIQKKMMESWSESFSKLGLPQDSELWNKSVSTWEQTVEKSMEAQRDWTKSWVESLDSIEGLPDQAAQSAHRFHEMTEQWLNTQQKLWASWFEMIKGMDVSNLSDNWVDMARDPIKGWQDATERVLETQSKWLQTWLGSGADES